MTPPDHQGQSRRVTADLTTPWWLSICLAAAFVILAALTAGPNTLRLDLRISEWVQNRGSWASVVTAVGNGIGETPYAFGLLVIALAGSLLKRTLRITAFLVLAAIGRVLAMSLKERLDSPRPSAAQVILGEHFDGFGFPSGHATTAAVVMGTLAFLTATLVHQPRWRWVMFGVAIIGMAITAFARIHAGAHWFTDTIGGALIGTTIILVAANLSAVFATRQQPAASQPEPAQIQAR